MTLSPAPSQGTDGDCRWMLWVDGCGGFLLLLGDQVQVGREVSGNPVDVGLLADVPRSAGHIFRVQDDYYWQAENGENGDRQDLSNPAERDRIERNWIERNWIEPGNKIGHLGSAKLRLQKPSALCNSAVLTLAPPHRFGGHIDAVLLVNQTWLIGPSNDCHVRCRSLSTPMVVTRRDAKWWIKRGFSGKYEELAVGQRISIGVPEMGNQDNQGNAEAADTGITMVLEPVANR